MEQRESPHGIWRFNHKCQAISSGKCLRIEVLEPAVVHWSADGWRTISDTSTTDSGIGLHIADLATNGLPVGTRLDFTFYWPGAGRWEGEDFSIAVSLTVPRGVRD